jgi:hypothetical protein
LSLLNPQWLVALSTLYLHHLAGEQPAVAGLLLRIESEWDFSLPYATTEEEEIHRGAAAVAEVVEEGEEHQLLRSPRLRPKQLSPKPQTSELWEPPHEYLKETEQRPKTSSTNSGITTASIEGWLDSILL